MEYLLIFVKILSFLFLLVLLIFSGVNASEFTNRLVDKVGEVKGNLLYIFYLCTVFAALLTLMLYLIKESLPDSVGYPSLIAVFI
jgi:hypothetical protein